MTAAVRRPRLLTVGFSLLLGLPLAACSDGEEPEAESGSWTVLHYSVADNNLEQPMSADVNALGEVGSRGDLHVREYLDRSPEYGDDEVLDQGSWVGARVFDLGEDGTTELVDDLGDVDSSDPATLADFISAGIKADPADHYALVISDHGGQWNGIGQDETSGGGLLTLPDLVEGISTGLDGTGVDKLDLLGFDACLMAGYEVAHAMAPLADRMVASQETEPGHGWDYRAFETATDGATPDELGSAIIDGFRQQSEDAGDVDGVTLSLLDLTRMDDLTAALEEFGSTLAEDPATAPSLGRAQAEVIGFGKSPDPAQDQYLSDLGELADAVGEEAPEVDDAAAKVSEAVDDVVIDDFAGDARQGATGLSIYLPPSGDFYATGYQDVADGPWNDFLQSYYGFGGDIAEAALPAFVEDEPAVEIDGDGTLSLSASYDPAAQDNLTEATISYAVYEDDGTVTYLGEEAATFGTGDDPFVVGTYDFTVLQMSDGEDTVTAYTDLTFDEDTGFATFDVPLSYYAPDDVNGKDPQDVLLSLVVDPDQGGIVSETYYAYDPDTSTYGEAILDPDGIVSPEVPNYDAEGNESWVATSDVGLYADLESITYDFVPVESGTELQVDLGLTDFGGNTAYSTTSVVAP